MIYLRRIWYGCGWLSCCGYHPGTFWLLWMLVLAMIVAGIEGMVAIGAFYGPFYLWGAYLRSKDQERWIEKIVDYTPPQDS